MSIYEELYYRIGQIPLIDIHTHIDLSHMSARGLHDLLLYHMLISELYSAGCPNAERLSEFPDEEEAKSRLQAAVPYIEHIRYSSCFSILKRMLKDLYGFTDTINVDNWEKLDSAVRERYKSGYAEEILKKANIAAVNTEYCRKRDLENNSFFYSLEWAFFTRSQYGLFDASIIELEIAASQKEPEGPIPVTAHGTGFPFRQHLKTVEEIDEAIESYVLKIPFDKIVSLPTHFSTDINYGAVTREDMAKALKARRTAGTRERDVYANYINNKYFEALSKVGKNVAVAISIGAEPLRYETASKLGNDTVFAIEKLANKYPDLNFIIFNGSDYQDTTLSTVIRETQNVYVAGFWWHSFFPSSMERIIRGRLERIPLNKWFGYFSDAYCVDWAYGKSLLIRSLFARILAKMVGKKYISYDDAVHIAERLLYRNAKEYFNL